MTSAAGTVTLYQFAGGSKTDNGRPLEATLEIGPAVHSRDAVVSLGISREGAGRPQGAAIELDREDTLRLHATIGDLLGL